MSPFSLIRALLTLRLLAAATVVLSVACLLIMGRQPVAVGLFTPPWDKLAHLTVFALIGAAAGIASGAKGGSRLVCCILVALAVGAVDEIHQHYLPGRSASWADLMADAMGGFIGGAMLQTASRAVDRHFRRR